MSNKIVRRLAALLLALSLVFTTGATTIFAAGGTVATESHKAGAKEKLVKLQKDGKITEEELNEFIKQVEEADSLEAIEEILGEAGFFDEEPEKDPLASQKVEAKEKLKNLKNQGKITEEQLNEYAKQVDAAESVDAIEEILAEAGFFDEEPEKDPLAKQKEEAKEKLKDLKNQGKITEEELNEYVKQIDAADSLDAIEEILAEAAKAGEKEPEKPGEEDGGVTGVVPVDPQKPQNSQNPVDSQKPARSQKGSGRTSNPKTGDIGIALSAVTLLTSAGAYVLTTRKKEDK